ncbi:XRE family transcriptional regulator [Eubacterium sp. TF05-29]|nr:XRE family transcriptional regulator [Eubacterium sp. AM47-9]RJW06391.1 XRE family transcriptional regulator [Eubacterium sp. AM28-8LB]RJW29262.1 XRE family transcriptional regulator [Eubacterium sp. TF05-29]
MCATSCNFRNTQKYRRFLYMCKETELVRATRQSKKISERTMAKLMGIKRKEYIAYENNLENISAFVCYRICLILGIDFNIL